MRQFQKLVCQFLGSKRRRGSKSMASSFAGLPSRFTRSARNFESSSECMISSPIQSSQCLIDVNCLHASLLCCDAPPFIMYILRWPCFAGMLRGLEEHSLWRGVRSCRSDINRGSSQSLCGACHRRRPAQRGRPDIVSGCATFG